MNLFVLANTATRTSKGAVVSSRSKVQEYYTAEPADLFDDIEFGVETMATEYSTKKRPSVVIPNQEQL